MVPKRDSDRLRLVIDLSRLNRFIMCCHFRMLSVAQVRLALRPGAWMVSLDLESAYWHVPVHPRFRRYLAVRVDDLVLQSTVMPFGLNIAPRVFTKLTKVVASLLARHGVSSLMYLDDWLLQASSRERVLRDLEVTLRVCRAMGFRFNLPKSCLVPSQVITWLGLSWDARSASVRLSDRNRTRLLQKLRRALFSRTFSGVCGKVFWGLSILRLLWFLSAGCGSVV